MTNHKIIFASTILLTSLLFITGCGGEEEQVETGPVVRTAPKSPPKPLLKSLDEIRQDVNADSRIAWIESDAPGSNAERENIFIFITAFLQNDNDTLRSMLSMSDQMELGTLSESADFEQVLEKITRVDIRYGSNPLTGESCMLAIYEIDMDYQPQFWSYEEEDGKFQFSSLESPPNLVDRLSGDWIKEYFKGKQELLAMAADGDQDSSYQLAGEGTTSGGGGDIPTSPNSPPQLPGKPNPTSPQTPNPNPLPGRGPMTPP
ncbi:MAG: hypothetical protein QGF07_02855 [Phycisphaerales bacterium]|jgi:hypothetical protein|nr:hypothetical protein [Phycisphaerales bacterium]